MKILKDRFCELSRSREFQSFLLNLNKLLYKNLMSHLQLGEGCQSNKKKMIEVYEKIKSNGELSQLEEFIVAKYPHMIMIDSNEITEIKEQKETDILKIQASNINELYNKMNYHKVFKIYKPSILTIPQRKIFIGKSKNDVNNSIIKFIKNKLNVDFIILKGPELWHGYVEYFDMKYKDSISDIDINKRPIGLYKKINNIN